jgi:hypothetical protein
LQGGIAGVTQNFTIQLVDSFGNNITNTTGQTVAVAVSLVSSTSTGTAAAIYLGNGLYNIGYTLTVAQNYSMSITVNGANISNHEQLVTVTPAAVDGPHCYAFGSGTIGGIVGLPVLFCIFSL